jgi:hypothetical protein
LLVKAAAARPGTALCTDALRQIIENLAVLGYDVNNLWMASYDWRLSYSNLEVRDRFFTRSE